MRVHGTVYVDVYCVCLHVYTNVYVYPYACISGGVIWPELFPRKKSVLIDFPKTGINREANSYTQGWSGGGTNDSTVLIPVGARRRGCERELSFDSSVVSLPASSSRFP